MKRTIKSLLAVAVMASVVVGITTTTATAHSKGAATAVSYINPDIGLPTVNPNIDPGSDCESPDRHDEQQFLSTPGTVDHNVHNDACLFDHHGDELDHRATFESSGVGVISACPDPDNAGPKTSTLSPDGLRCTQSGFQAKGIAGDGEYHVRLNNTTTSGLQTVVFCLDTGAIGCADDTVKDVVDVTWLS